jgi:uncharacterized protein YqiB (DUF1249 family)
MRKIMLVVSMAVALAAMAGCKENAGYRAERQAMNGQMCHERKFMDQAIKDHSPDVQRVDLIDSTVVYTHIYDGIIDIKEYTFNGDVCVEVERVYTFPNQMMALRHYRNAIERAELYDNIQLFNNQVKYDLKKEQHELETKGLTKEQLKAKFEAQIEKAKADLKHHKK